MKVEDTTPPVPREYTITVNQEELEFLVACSKVAYSQNNEEHQKLFRQYQTTLQSALPSSTPRFWIKSSSSLETLVRPPAYRKDSE